MRECVLVLVQTLIYCIDPKTLGRGESNEPFPIKVTSANISWYKQLKSCLVVNLKFQIKTSKKAFLKNELVGKLWTKIIEYKTLLDLNNLSFVFCRAINKMKF